MSLHRYLYVTNQPVNKVDPTGRLDCDQCLLNLISCMKDAASAYARCLGDCGKLVALPGAYWTALACGLAGYPKPAPPWYEYVRLIAVAICLGVSLGTLIALIRCWETCDKEYDIMAESCSLAYEWCKAHCADGPRCRR